jgi:hypothetical protein
MCSLCADPNGEAPVVHVGQTPCTVQLLDTTQTRIHCVLEPLVAADLPPAAAAFTLNLTVFLPLARQTDTGVSVATMNPITCAIAAGCAVRFDPSRQPTTSRPRTPSVAAGGLLMMRGDKLSSTGPPPIVFTIVSGSAYCELTDLGCITDGGGSCTRAANPNLRPSLRPQPPTLAWTLALALALTLARPWALTAGAPLCRETDGNNERCTVRAESDVTVSATSFATESCCDSITIGTTRFRGSSGPTNVAMTAGTTLAWASDSSVTGGGWEICPVTSAASGRRLQTSSSASSTEQEVTHESSVEVRVSQVGASTATQTEGHLCGMRRTREGTGAEASIDTDQGLMLGPARALRCPNLSQCRHEVLTCAGVACSFAARSRRAGGRQLCVVRDQQRDGRQLERRLLHRCRAPVGTESRLCDSQRDRPAHRFPKRPGVKRRPPTYHDVFATCRACCLVARVVTCAALPL